MATTPPDDLIGTMLGQFEILDEIGRGGMATVYRARQRSINRVVAVKVLPRALLHDPGFYERFTREVDVIAHLEHPHILPIYDYGEAGGIPYIAMRYLAGGSMAQLIRRGLPPIESLVKPMSQIGQALDHAHQQGIIHRDLKPGNILLDDRGNAYLTDFGIARVLNSNLTGSAIIGTPAYMSPEQANGLPLDARSDVYALGVVLFELITGREPFEAETPVALLLKHINEPMPSVKQYRAGVPSAVEQVIYKATAKTPDNRYPSAGDLAAAYVEAAYQPASRPDLHMQPPDDQPTIVPEPGSPIRLTPPRVTPPPSTPAGYPTPVQTAYPGTEQHAGTQPTTKRRSMALPILAGLVVVGIVLIGATLALINRPPDVPPATPTPAVAVLPTPFDNARVARNDLYTISVPDSWQFTELTPLDPSELLTHVWQHGLDAYVGLTLIPVENDDEFEEQIDTYVNAHFSPENTQLIDETTSPDGTVRHSYRMSGEFDPPFEDGQVDVFFFERSPFVAVLELYSADSYGNEIVPDYQQVLDSLRINTEAAQG
jgi:serine/threonine-protein kinase